MRGQRKFLAIVYGDGRFHQWERYSPTERDGWINAQSAVDREFPLDGALISFVPASCGIEGDELIFDNTSPDYRPFHSRQGMIIHNDCYELAKSHSIKE